MKGAFFMPQNIYERMLSDKKCLKRLKLIQWGRHGQNYDVALLDIENNQPWLFEFFKQYWRVHGRCGNTRFMKRRTSQAVRRYKNALSDGNQYRRIIDRWAYD